MRWNSDQQDSLFETRIVLHPMLGPHDGIDVTDPVLDAIAAEINRQCEGNGVLNRIEAECLLNSFLQTLAKAMKLHGEMR